MKRGMLVRSVVASTALAILGANALAQSQPSRIVVPFTSGGAADTFTRLLASELTGSLGNTVVDNRPGASGAIAADFVARATPDGRTLMFGSNSTLVNNTALFAKLSYDPQKDFALVSHIGYQPMIWVVRADLPIRSMTELVAYAKENPGKLNRGSSGAGNITNLSAAVFTSMTGASMTHIPFGGDTPALQAMFSGNLDIHVSGITAVLPHVKAGRARVLGVMDSRRLADVPDAPTLREAGIDLEAAAWYCLVVPAATPRETVDRINAAINTVLAKPDVIQKVRALGIEPRAGSVQDLERFVAAERARWIPTIRNLGIKPE